MSTLIGALRVTLGLDTAAFEKGASSIEKRSKGLERSIEGFGKKLSGMGQTLSLAVTAPLTAFGITAVKAAMESRDALGQVEATLKSMGNASGRTAEQLQALAGKQMRQSLYDDDEILRKVTANLLTFGKVAGDNFERAQMAAINLSARMGTDLQSSTLMVGKALNDPVRGLNALRRTGIQFTAQQEAQIKAMVAVGDAAGAQKIMLAELERQFGGAAEAARKADPMAAMKQSFADFQETVGEKLLPLLPAITDAISNLLDAFGSLSPGMQQAVVIGGALAAALGPVLMGVGALVQGFAPMIAIATTLGGEAGLLAGIRVALMGLAAGFGPLLAPIAAVAAAGYLIYQNWDKIAPVLEGLWQTAQETLGPPLQELVATIGSALRELWDGPLGSMIKTVGAGLIEFQLAYGKVLGTGLIAVLKVAIETFANLFRSIGDGVRIVNALLNGDFSGALNAVGSLVNRIFSGLPAKILGWMAEIAKVGRDIVLGLARGIRDNAAAVWNALKSVVTGGIDNAKALLGIKSPSRVFMEIGDYIAQGLALGIEGGKGKVDEATRKLTEAARKAAEETKALFARLFPEIEQANNYRADLARIEGASVSGDAKDQARRRLGLEATNTGGDIPLSDAVQEQGPLITDGIDKVLEKFNHFGQKAGSVTVNVAKSFKDMAEATIQSLSNLANAIKGGGFLDILSAVVGLGLQLGSIGAFGKGVAARINSPKIPGYAGGTNFHPGGLAMINERGPEIVDLPRGARVYPHGTGPSGGNTYNFQGNLMTPEFWSVIQQGDERAAHAGAGLARTQVATSRQWSLAE